MNENMTLTKSNTAISIAGTALVLSFVFAGAASALTVSCTGVAATSGIAWTASSSGGISPVAFLWGNGSTSSAQTVSATPGTYSITIQATDASSTVATSTCSATIAAPANATTTPPAVGASIQAQIQALLAQINALKAQIAALVMGHVGGGTATTTPPVVIPPVKACHHGIGRDIARGDFGDDIKDLQKFLAKHPNLYPEGIVNGFYGPHTMQAVRRWQKLHGIKPTGFFGKLSREAWRKHCDDDDDDDDQTASSTISVSGSASTTLGAWIDQELAKGKNGHGKSKGKGNDRNDD